MGYRTDSVSLLVGRRHGALTSWQFALDDMNAASRHRRAAKHRGTRMPTFRPLNKGQCPCLSVPRPMEYAKAALSCLPVVALVYVRRWDSIDIFEPLGLVFMLWCGRPGLGTARNVTRFWRG